MTWKKAVLVLSVVIALILTLIAVHPADVSELREHTDVRLSQSAKIPFHHAFSLTGFALSGSWEGSGSAKVWLVGGEKRYLVLDTKAVTSTLEFSSFGTRFESACDETCSIPPLQAEYLLIVLSGPGFLTIDSYHMAIPLEPTGFLSYPKTVFDLPTPNHALFLLALLLLISVIGSHALGHYCRNLVTKRIVLMVFLGAFIALGSVFGVTLLTPTSAFSIVTKQVVSVFAAFVLVVLVVLTAFEILVHRQPGPKQDVWKDLEDAEEKWEK
ncbi:Uncharacterised protein [uncultured archaeon]|nr:Uncharacterised protein [uncultured archaeon]